MKIKEKMKLEDLYFGVKLMPFLHSPMSDGTDFQTYNLFDFAMIKWSVARWVTMTDEEKKFISNPLGFIFGDVHGRVEYEFVICPWAYGDGDGESNSGMKVDLYRLYVEPNRELLLDLVSRVSKTSAQRYLREWRKKYRRNK